MYNNDLRNYGPKKITLTEIDKKTGRVISVERNVRYLSESSLNRMMEHGKSGMVIISSNRSAIDSENPEQSLRDEYNTSHIESEDEFLMRRNIEADEELKRDIRAAGYSYSPVYGGYHGTDDVQDIYEPSYVVYNYNLKGEPGNFNDLEQFAVNMCRKYKQDSVYVQRPGEPPVYLDANGNQVNVSSSDNFKFNRDDEMFYTTSKREKSNPQKFTADIVFEDMCCRLNPASLNERMRRQKSGEYFL